MQGGLGGPTERVLRGEGVEAILENVVVGCGEGIGEETIDLLVGSMEFKAVVGGGDGDDKFGGFSQSPLIERIEVGGVDLVLGGVEVVQVAELEAEAVPNETVGLGNVFEDLVGDGNVVAEILGGDPEADDIGAEGVDVAIGSLGFSIGFGDFLSVSAHDKAVGDDLAVRRCAIGDGGSPEGGLKPAAVLIAALKVEIGRPVEIGVVLKNGAVGATGIDPDVEGVLTGDEVSILPASGEGDAVEELSGILLKPDGGAVEGYFPSEGLDDLGVEEAVAGGGVEKGRDGNTPGALAADAPVGAILDGTTNPVFAPRRFPANFLKVGEDLIAETVSVEGNKPLIHGAKDNRGLGAPAVGVGVVVFFNRKEGAGFFEEGEDSAVGWGGLLVSLEDGFADEGGGDGPVVEVGSLVVKRAIDFQVVTEAGEVVLHAVTGGGVYATSTSLGGDVVGENEGAGPIDEGVNSLHALKIAAEKGWLRGGEILNFEEGGQLGSEVSGNEEIAALVGEGKVLKAGMEGDGEIGRDGPRGGGPDDNFRIGREAGLTRIGNLEGDVDAGRDVVPVLDFGLGESGFARDGPVDGFFTSVNEALADEGSKGAQDGGLVLGVEGFVLVGPVGKDTEALELGALGFDELAGELFAFPTQLGGGQLAVGFAELAGDFMLNREPVAVPTGEVGCPVATHRLVPYDGIFEGFIKSSADVDIAIGERGAIVKDKKWLALVVRLNAGIEV